MPEQAQHDFGISILARSERIRAVVPDSRRHAARRLTNDQMSVVGLTKAAALKSVDRCESLQVPKERRVSRPFSISS
jgi:hypothetical protein